MQLYLLRLAKLEDVFFWSGERHVQAEREDMVVRSALTISISWEDADAVGVRLEG